VLGEHTHKIIADSKKHWKDAAYFDRIGRDTNIIKRRPQKIKTVAIYYNRLNNGGIERVMSLLSRLLADAGYSVIVITDGTRGGSDYDCGPLVKRRYIPKNQGVYSVRANALCELLLQENVDVLIHNQFYKIDTIWDMLVTKSLGIPVVIGWHGVFDATIVDIKDYETFKLGLQAFVHADLISCLSSMDTWWFSSQGCAAKLVHNPSTVTYIPTVDVNPDCKTVLYIGRIEHSQKRVLDVVRAFSLVKKTVPDAKLVLVGDGGSLQACKDLVRSLDLAQSVDLAGYQAEVTPYIRQSAVHVMTSRHEGAPMVLGEVWIHGVPTVMCDLPYLEYCKSGKGFVSVKQGDIQALADEIAGLLRDPERRIALGLEARDVAAGFLNLDVAQQWRQVFADLEREGSLARQPTAEETVRYAPMAANQLKERLFDLSGDAAFAKRNNRMFSKKSLRRQFFTLKAYAASVLNRSRGVTPSA
jgi:glycosyltransferase involved in cell wall biosynthesis